MTMTDVAADSAAPDSLRSDLVAGVMKSNRRRRRRRMVGIAGVGVFGFMGVLSIDSPEPAYAVMKAPNGVVEVEVFPELDDVDDLQQALADVGLEATVVNLRAHPSLVGVVEVTGHENQNSGAMTSTGDGRFSIDAAKVTGPVEVLIYSEAQGEQYQAAPSIFRPGQPLAGLHCAFNDGPLPTEVLETRAIEAGLTEFEWTVFGEMDPETFEIETKSSKDRPDGFVVGASMGDETTLSVFVSEDERAPATEVISMHDGTHRTESPECTPELAAPWSE